MYFLIDACKNPTILRVLYFGYLFWEIVAVLVPIGLIIMLMIDFTKAVVISKEDEQVKSMKLVVKRIMYAVFIFATPWIVSLIMGILGDAGIDVGGDYTVCLNTVKNISAGTDSIEKYDELYDTEEKANENKNKNNSNNGNNVGNNSSSPSNASTIANNLINLAKGEKGHVGGNKYSGMDNSVPWCAYFTVWALENTKYDNTMSLYDYINKEGLVSSKGGANGLMPAFKNGSRSNFNFYPSKAYGGTYTPKKGDIVWFWYDSSWGFSWDGRLSASHVGMVDSVAGSELLTIEGNTGGNGSANNKVNTQSHSLNSSYIIAYGSWY